MAARRRAAPTPTQGPRSGSDLHLVCRPRAAHAPARRARAGRRRRPVLAEPELARCCARSPTRAQWESTRRPRARLRLRHRRASAASAPTTSTRRAAPAAVFRLIPEKIATLEELNMPPGGRDAGPPAQRARAGHRADRLGQVDHARRDHRPDQRRRTTSTSSRSRTRSSSCTRTRSSIVLAARGRAPHRVLRRRAARRDPPEPGRDPGRRDARPGEIELAITAAEMGALVFGTLHTNSATKTIDRLIDVFPTDEQEQIRISSPKRSRAWCRSSCCRTADGKGRVRGQRDPDEDRRAAEHHPRGQHAMISDDHPGRQAHRHADDGRSARGARAQRQDSTEGRVISARPTRRTSKRCSTHPRMHCEAGCSTSTIREPRRLVRGT